MKHLAASGLTLIELMITLLIGSIILSTSISQIGVIASRIQFESIQQSLISGLLFARAEAIENGGLVAACASTTITSSSVSCSATSDNWSSGWIIFIDRNNNGIFDPAFDRSPGAPARAATDDEMLMMRHLESNARISWERNNTISFLANGATTATNVGAFSLCDANGNADLARGININLSGRVRPTATVSCP